VPEHETSDPYAPTMRRSVFEARGRTYTLGHVFSAAAFGGWIGGFWRDLADALACASYAGDEGFEIDTAELQSSADQFRYQRNLVTAEETERWLSDRDVDEDDMIAWLERRYWLERFSREARGMQDSYTSPPSVITDVLWPEVVFSGCLGPLAVPLARRVAAAAAEAAGGPVSISNDLTTDARAAFFERAGCGPEGLAAWLERNRCTTEWFQELLALETRFLRARTDALSPERCSAALESRRLDLLRVRFQVARFATERHAREAHLCITDDGEPFTDATRRAGAHAEEQTLLLEDAPESLRPLLLSAAEGEVIQAAGPENEPLVVQVIDKTLPRISDPEVRARLEPVLVSKYFDPLVETEVRWTVPLEPSP
jgi:hypothetical protein